MMLELGMVKWFLDHFRVELDVEFPWGSPNCIQATSIEDVRNHQR
jgi:hypothetical protein